MAKKKKHPEHVNMERWLVSYADFMTLMFVLFIILFAFSQVDIEKYKSLAGSLSNEFAAPVESGGGKGNPVMDFPGAGPGQIEVKTPAQIEDENLADVAQAVVSYAQEKGISSNINLRSNEKGLYITITGTVLFNDASATLTPQAKDFIKVIFEKLKELPNNILIEGHTDNRPINTIEFPSNWELSSARSLRLVRYLIEEYRFSPERLSSAAYGEYRPLVPNDSVENMAKNRRVEVIILKTYTKEGEKRTDQ